MEPDRCLRVLRLSGVAWALSSRCYVQALVLKCEHDLCQVFLFERFEVLPSGLRQADGETRVWNCVCQIHREPAGVLQIPRENAHVAIADRERQWRERLDPGKRETKGQLSTDAGVVVID